MCGCLGCASVTDSRNTCMCRKMLSCVSADAGCGTPPCSLCKCQPLDDGQEVPARAEGVTAGAHCSLLAHCFYGLVTVCTAPEQPRRLSIAAQPAGGGSSSRSGSGSNSSTKRSRGAAWRHPGVWLLSMLLAGPAQGSLPCKRCKAAEGCRDVRSGLGMLPCVTGACCIMITQVMPSLMSLLVLAASHPLLVHY